MNQGTLRQTKDLENAEWVGQFNVQLEDTTPLVVVVLLLLFISWCGLSTTKRKEEYTSCYNGFGLKVLLSDDHIAIFKILL